MRKFIRWYINDEKNSEVWSRLSFEEKIIKHLDIIGAALIGILGFLGMILLILGGLFFSNVLS